MVPQYAHCSDIMSAMASQTTSISIVCSSVCSGAHQRKHQSSALLACVREFPSQRASKDENVSIYWRHHGNESVCAFSIYLKEMPFPLFICYILPHKGLYLQCAHTVEFVTNVGWQEQTRVKLTAHVIVQVIWSIRCIFSVWRIMSPLTQWFWRGHTSCLGCQMNFQLGL